MAQLAAADPRHRRPATLAPPGRRRAPATWQWLWAPFWLGSEVPLVPPVAETARDQPAGAAGEHVRRDLAHIGRRIAWRNVFHLLGRALWLTLAAGCLWQLAAIAGGPAVRWPVLLWLGGVLAGLALVFALLNRPGRSQTARMLDRSFQLEDRLLTALDQGGPRVAAPGRRAAIPYLQTADAANVLADLRDHPALGIQLPVREVVPAIGLALLLAAFTFLRGSGEAMPAVVPASVPKFTPAAARPAAPDQVALSPENTELPPSVDEVMARAEDSQAAAADLNRLAEALTDHAVTKPAADAIRDANYGGAGDELRAAAPTADQLSPAAREALARDLDAAAGDMGPESQDLQDAAANAAAGLREGGEPARTEVSALGDAVEQAGGRVASPEELASQMQRAQEGERRQQQQQQARPQGSGEGQAESREQSAADPAAQAGEPAQSGADAPAGGGEPGEQESASQAPGDGNEPGAGEQQGASGQPGESGAPGEANAPGEGGAPAPLDEAGGSAAEARGDAGTDASQGPGAAGGDSAGESPQGRGVAAGGPEAAQAGEAEENVTAGVGERASAPAPQGGGQSVELGAEAGSDGIQTVNNAGGTVRGSGAGITAGAGTATQGEVGAAGPDSNHVPPEYRSVVERYFSNQDDR